ncbi:MAG TPA: class 1 fructose-bisphosphatase [Gemmatimonadetes bacterium]|jgi:fructose-1,6-bisphosphatase I|nr:class 1 fructose-bisphosphatase [Gemmatimonadota bacterium]|tara:strand:+ start:2493 stop:3488 length:996 start_codon:yes stop_codon:yes gene_type:complete
MLEKQGLTISRFLVEEERRMPRATGVFTGLLNDIALAAKIISREVNHAGLAEMLGDTGEENSHGERVQKLDIFADDVMRQVLHHTGLITCMASEEKEFFWPVPDSFPSGEYVVIYDPLDGSSNIDVNVSIGTIFSIHSKISSSERGELSDCLQAGKHQVAAGYVLYGSSTMFVYTTGRGVHGFTLDPSLGEFVLSHESMCFPDPPRRVYSINEAHYNSWKTGQQLLIDHLKDGGDFSSRYIGSLVADFHRTLLQGGIFMYPSGKGAPEGKLRLLYECSPIAMLAKQAGGRASTGARDVLEVIPDSLHQRVPLYVGNSELVDLAEEFLAEED